MVSEHYDFAETTPTNVTGKDLPNNLNMTYKSVNLIFLGTIQDLVHEWSGQYEAIWYDLEQKQFMGVNTIGKTVCLGDTVMDASFYLDENPTPDTWTTT